MSELTWGTVLGGTGRPRFIICGTELVENGSFEANTYGWVGSPSTDKISREEDSATYWGDYSCQISDDGAQVSRSKARYALEASSALANKSFAVSMYVKSDVASTCSVQLSSLDETLAIQEKAITTTYGHFFGVFSFSTSIKTAFNLDVFAAAGGSYSNIINIDKASCREVSNNLYAEFPYSPNTDEPEYAEDLLSSGRLVDGSLKEYRRGWAPRFLFRYDYLDQTTEYYRRLLSEADFIWLQPHYDYEYYVAVKWDGKWSQQYFGGVHAGHVGEMAFKSIYLLESKPLDIV